MNVVDSSAWLSYFATAQKYAAVLWTQDNDFEGLEKVRYISKKSK